MFSSYLSDAQIQRLKKHEYSCESYSLTERYVFQPFWSWCATLLPLWVAPNLITITGLGFNIVTSMFVIVSSPRANEHSVPPFVFVLCAIGLFVYQTLDAIDGKQARRTNTATPLGELFDHGCDAISTIFVTTSLACSVSLGAHPYYLFFFFISVSTYYYLAFWQYYCLGKLIFNYVDVNEALVASMLVYLTAGVVGPQVFLIPVTIFGYDLNVIKIAVLLKGFFALNYIFLTLYRVATQQNRADVNVLFPAVPLAVIFACAFYIFTRSRENLFQTHPCLFMLMFGRSLAKLTCNLIVTTMSKSSISVLDSIMIGPCVLVGFIFVRGFAVAHMLGLDRLTEYHVLLGVDVFNGVQFLLYVSAICREVSKGLGVNIFTIPYDVKSKDS